MAQNEREWVIDFTSYITERTENFTGREWVFQAINDWLANPDGSRFFLLRGEPGSGKTAISARLSQFAEGTVSPPDGLRHLHPDFLSAVHFCSARDSRWINPRVFTESLALQLAKRYPVYNEELAEKSGDRSIRIEVHQQIEQGSGVGVLIKELDVGGATPEDAFNRVVREPLEALVAEALDVQIVMLVDALDEALSSTITPTIVSLLSQTDNLPSRVRFIVTTRQESRVENKFRNVNELSLSIPYDQRNQIDIRRYVRGRLQADLKLAAQAEQAEPAQITQLVEVVPQKAEGNFLYARFLLDAMAKGLRSLSELDGLPTGLDALYFDSLNRVVELGKRDWFTEYRPLMGVLSAAQESLTLTQLQAFTVQPESAIWQSLSDLQQFIQEASPQDGQAEQDTRYRLYHQSVSDFLSRKWIFREQKQSLNDYYIPPDEWHKKLVDVCEQGDLSIIWNDIKRNAVEQSRREYARRYYITHLYLAQEWQKLFEVLDTRQYGQSKIHDDPSTRSYALDLDLGRQTAMWEGWTLQEGIALLPRLWRYTLLRCSLTSRADQYPEEAFRLLVLLGRKQEALGLAELLTDPAKKVRVLQCIAWQLRQQANEGVEWLDLFMRASDIARTIQDNKKQAEALSGLGLELAQAQQWEQAEHVINAIQDNYEQAEALSALATALAQAQQWKRGIELWEQAEHVINIIQDNKKQAEALSALATALAEAQQWTEAERISSTIQDSYEQAEALTALVRALAQAQQWTEAERISNTIQDNKKQAEALSTLTTALAQAQQWPEAERIIGTIHNSYQHARALRELGTALAQAQQWEHANQAWTEAELEIDTIQWGNIRAQALRYLGLALAQAQQWTEAERIIKKISGKSRLGSALSALASALAQAQQWAEAERIIEKISGRPQLNRALSALATALAQAQQWAEAERVIVSITDSLQRAETLTALGTALAQAQQWERASQVWAEAKNIIDDVRLDPLQDRALSALDIALAQAQQWTEAKRVIVSITDSLQHAKTLSALATALAQAQQWAEAERVIVSITDSLQRAETLTALGTALAQAQQRERASQIWVEAKFAIDEIQDSSQHVKALTDLGTALIQAQQQERAFQIWAEAERAISSITDSSQRVDPLSTLSMALAQAQQWTEAERVIGTLEYSYQRVEALSDLGTALAQAQQWAEAERVISSITQPDKRVKALSDLGTALVQAQQRERAFQIWAEAKRTIAEIGGLSEYIGALSALSTALAQAQQWTEAEHVIDMLHVEDEQVVGLSALGTAYAQAQQWERASQAWFKAERVIGAFQFSNRQARALSALCVALAQAQQWAEANRILNTISDRSEKAEAVRGMATAMASAGEFEQLLHMIQRAWRQVETRDEALTLFSLATVFISRKPVLGIAFFDAFTWVDTFLSVGN